MQKPSPSTFPERTAERNAANHALYGARALDGHGLVATLRIENPYILEALRLAPTRRLRLNEFVDRWPGAREALTPLMQRTLAQPRGFMSGSLFDPRASLIQTEQSGIWHKKSLCYGPPPLVDLIDYLNVQLELIRLSLSFQPHPWEFESLPFSFRKVERDPVSRAVVQCDDVVRNYLADCTIGLGLAELVADSAPKLFQLLQNTPEFRAVPPRERDSGFGFDIT